MLYVLTIVLCMGGVCESYMWRDLVPAWECMDEAHALEGIRGDDWHIDRAVCKRMFETGGSEV